MPTISEKDYMEEIRKFIRKKAPQVKSFELDRLFTGEITCYERKDLGPKGYKTIERKFKNLKELEEYYDKPKVEKRVESSDKGSRGRPEDSGNRVAGKVGDVKSKKTNIR